MSEPSKSEVILAETRRILVIDDDDDGLRMARAVLEGAGYEVEALESGKGVSECVEVWRPHLLLLDINMPGINGLETLNRLREQKDYTSVLFVSARSRVEDVIAGLDSGADDYIRKPYDPRELLARVRVQLRIKDLRDDLQLANERLRDLVELDDLTGLYNMRSIYDKISHEIHRGQRFERAVCVVMLDMDNFKTVNDNHDHLFGSFVLREVGKLIKEGIRRVDIGARYGGDEFLIVLCETSLDGAQMFCDRLRRTIAEKDFTSGSDSIRLTASMGLAITDPVGSQIDAQSLVRQADRALYAAKADGRNCVHYYDYASQRSGRVGA